MNNQCPQCGKILKTLNNRAVIWIKTTAAAGGIYGATAAGTTKATLNFKYGAVMPTTKSHISDSMSKVYTFNILPLGGKSPTVTTSTIPQRNYQAMTAPDL